MSNDDPEALQRALTTLKDIIGGATPDVPTKLAKAAVAEAVVVKPDSLFQWLASARKQIAPHANKVPLPIIHGVAKVFPPAGVAVPLIRYLQTPASKHASGSSTGPVAPVVPQIFIIPVASPQISSSARSHSLVTLRRSLLGLVGFCQDRPGLALLVAYALYRARRLPGKALRALDRALDEALSWFYEWILRKTKHQRLWLVLRLERLRDQILASTSRFFTPVQEREGVAGPEGEEHRVQLDIGDAAWVGIVALVALYIAYTILVWEVHRNGK